MNSKIRFEEGDIETGLKLFSSDELREMDIDVVSKEIQIIKGAAINN